jgi:CBS domain-containing protein
MSEENHFFSPVGEVANPNIVSCDATSTVTEVARLMREHGISSVIVSDQGKPHGIISDRDLRNKVVAAGLAPDDLTARDIMTAPFLAISADRPLHEALHQMSRRRIHRLCVLDGKGELAGIVTSTDIMRLQARSALGLILDIEQAASVDALAPLHERVQELVLQQVRQGVPTNSLVRTVAHLNDRILIRLIELVREKDFPNLTTRFAFLVLGSEGRGEQTMATDQDNAIVYADDLSPEEVEELTRFSEAVIAALIGIGVPECPGGIMAKNPIWRRSLSAWQGTLAQWFATAKSENILSGSMFFDQRTVYGDPAFEGS